MPHKHTRKGESSRESFNLAPDAAAQPLPAYTKASLIASKPQEKRAAKKKKKKQVRKIAGYGLDDTPRAFARLMQAQGTKRPRSAPDEGDRPAAKKKAKTEAPALQPAAAPPDVPKIMPGERLVDFSARVNQAIPIAGLIKRGKVTIDGVQERQTRKEKKMHKMYAEWREQDAKIKAKREEAAEQAEEAEEDRMAEYGGQDVSVSLGHSTKRQRAIGEVGKMDDDPWAVLKKKRQTPRGLHDVAQAPPELKPPREMFKVKNGAKLSIANVPASAGSLKKREELSEARREVIERYRSMMKAGT